MISIVTERGVINLGKLRWAGYVARTGSKRNIYRVLVGKIKVTEGKRPVRSSLNNTKILVTKYDGKSQTVLIWVRIWKVAGCCEHVDETLDSIKRDKYPDWLRNC